MYFIVPDPNVFPYVTDTGSSLSQVVAEVDGDGRETASYTLGDERISVERDGKIWYYLHDGHGSVRMLAGEDGQITDSYSYDAYGNCWKGKGIQRMTSSISGSSTRYGLTKKQRSILTHSSVYRKATSIRWLIG